MGGGTGGRSANDAQVRGLKRASVDPRSDWNQIEIIQTTPLTKEAISKEPIVTEMFRDSRRFSTYLSSCPPCIVLLVAHSLV